jgi:hypothetical protein
VNNERIKLKVIHINLNKLEPIKEIETIECYREDDDYLYFNVSGRKRILFGGEDKIYKPKLGKVNINNNYYVSMYASIIFIDDGTINDDEMIEKLKDSFRPCIQYLKNSLEKVEEDFKLI